MFTKALNISALVCLSTKFLTSQALHWSTHIALIQNYKNTLNYKNNSYSNRPRALRTCFKPLTNRAEE